ncbi:hypothetical protein quinque_006322 [Culex quinquefasciatus]
MINPEMEPLKYKWNDSERRISYEPDDLCIDPTKLDEAQNEGVAIARKWNIFTANDSSETSPWRSICSGLAFPFPGRRPCCGTTIPRVLPARVLPETDLDKHDAAKPELRRHYFTGGRYDGADLRRLCRTLRVDAFRTRDLHCNSYVENEQEDKEDEEVCRFCLKADGGAALVELFPGGGGSVADDAGAGEAGGRDGFVGFVQHWQREWGRGWINDSKAPGHQFQQNSSQVFGVIQGTKNQIETHHQNQ